MWAGASVNIEYLVYGAILAGLAAAGVPTIDVNADLAARARKGAPRAQPAVGGALAKYAALVSSASEGAVTRPVQATSTSPGGS